MTNNLTTPKVPSRQTSDGGETVVLEQICKNGINMLKRLVIEKLFGTFDYSIDLKPEGLTVITGPNGYGKTTILRILEALAKKNLLYFLSLPFQKIELYFDKGEPLIIAKNSNSDFSFQKGDKKESIKKKEAIKFIAERFSLTELSNDVWLEHLHGVKLNTREVFSLLQDEMDLNPHRIRWMLPFAFFENYEFPKVFFIKEQRLLQKIRNDNSVGKRRFFRKPAYYVEIIEGYAKRLKEVMVQADSEYAEKSRELDSSYPRRLFESKEVIVEEDFRSRFEKIKETQRLLAEYGLSVTKEENPPGFDQSNAKALSIYLNDVEAKLQVFDQLLKALNLFSEILNSRSFVNKKIEISKEFGLRFTADDGTTLQLSELSSGEQHEVVMLFDLLFQTDPNTLILIDEPEISLHVVWQKEFLSDMRKMIKLRDVTVLVATHSPQIIGGEWDSVCDLYDLAEGRKGHETAP